MYLFFLFAVLALMVLVSIVTLDAKEAALGRLGWRIGFLLLFIIGGLVGVRYSITRAVPCFPDCTGINFLDRNFSERDFTSGNFVDSYMPRVDFSNADLRNSDFSGANLRHSDFKGADLRFTFFIGTDLESADLGAAQLQNASFQGADLTESNLAGVNLSQTDLSGAILNRATLVGADLSGARLTGIELRGADLSGADLSGAQLAGASLSEANLSGADLSGANLQGTFINLATLTGADLTDAKLAGASLIGTDLSSVNLRRAELVGALIMGARFDGADLRGAQLRYMRDVDQVTPEDLELDPVLAGMNALQREAITVPSRLEGIVVDANTLAPAELLPAVAQVAEDTTERQVNVAILHSVSGDLAFGESAVLDATLLAIREINAAGGILGRKIVPIVEDGASDPRVFAEKTTKLLEIDEVDVMFGVSTTASRKAIIPILDKNSSLLFYPTQHEGLEVSDNIIYMGADPSQQIVPTIEYLLAEGFETFFLIGSDREYAHIAHPLIKAQLANAGAEVTGEVLVPLKNTNLAAAVREIAFLKPAVVINTLVGVSNKAFFEAFAEERIAPTSLPIISFGMGETEVQEVGVEFVAGHLIAASYFQTVNTIENFTFVDAYKETHGRESVTSDAIMYGYASVYLWEALVRQARSFDVEAIKQVVEEIPIELETPNGMIQLDAETKYIAKPLRIGRIRDDGLIEEIFTTGNLIAPDPFLTEYDWAEEIVTLLLEEEE
ncbi:MAG: transporter substrate-binding protein [Candidatus Promineifilaceae bacterium]